MSSKYYPLEERAKRITCTLTARSLSALRKFLMPWMGYVTQNVVEFLMVRKTAAFVIEQLIFCIVFLIFL